MQIRIQALANLAQAEAQFAALTKQVSAFNAQLARSSMIPAGGSVKGFANAQSAARGANREFANALASSGAFRAEQVKLPNVINKTTEALQAQKLTFGQVFGKTGRANMRAVYKDQLALRNAFSTQMTGGVGGGKSMSTLAVPSKVPESWDNLRNRIGFFRAELKSASTQMVNWGKNMQWSGRQLMVGLTLPAAAFGAAAGVMAYKVDKEFTRIKKVYDTTADANSSLASDMKAYATEIATLQTAAFKTAGDSARDYGVAVNDTLSVQADLAATGIKGSALQAATTQVVRNATLGEIDYQTATSATIALQQQLHLSNTELADSWAYMNAVENATSLGMKDFAEAIPIALSPIRQMGGDLHDLGTLMTAMVSRGVEVGKAANAIKAMPQRLSRPSKQVQEEFKALTGQDIVELNKKNPDNIIALLTSIEDATKNLSTFDRRKALAGLFGSYQLSTMSAMLQGMDDLSAGIGQTSDAFKIGTQDAKQWAEISDREIKAFQDSAAGKFKIAIESIKSELATMGEPFLEVATRFLDVGAAIFKFFNGLPSIVKKGFIVAVLFGAILGPIIMLTGLFVQLAGNVGKMIAASLRLAKGMDILTIAQIATNAEAKLMDAGFIKEADSATLLTERLKALTSATMAQQRAMTNMMGAPGSSASGLMHGPKAYTPSPLPIVAAYPKTPVTPAQLEQSVQQALASQIKKSPTGKSMWAAGQKSPTTGKGGFVSGADMKLVTAQTEMAVKAQYALAQAHMESLGFVSLEVKNAEAINAARKFTLNQERMITAEKEKQRAAYAASDAAAARATTAMLPGRKIPQAASVVREATIPLPALPTLRDNAGWAERKGYAAAAKERARVERANKMNEKAAQRRIAAAKLEAKAVAGVENNMNGAAVAGGAMAASMILMTATSNEAANNVGQMLMFASIGIPAFKAMGGPLASAGARVAKMGTDFKIAALNAMATSKASTGASIATARLAGAAGTARAGFMGMRAAMLAIMGPIGWAVTAIAAIGFIAYKVHKNRMQELKEEREAQQALNDTALHFADHLGEAAKQYQKIATTEVKIGTADPSAFQDARAYYAEGDGKKDITKFKDMSDEDQRNRAMQTYVDLMVQLGYTADQAATNVAGMFAASGDSAFQATVRAKELKDEIGSLDTLDWEKSLTNFRENLFPKSKDVKDDAAKYAQLWSQAFASANDRESAEAVLSEGAQAALSNWNSVFDQMKEDKDSLGTAAFLDENDITNAKELEHWYKVIGDRGDAITSLQKGGVADLESGKALYSMIQDADEYERTIIGAIAANNGLGDSVDTVIELQNDANIMAKRLTYDEAKTSALRLVDTWKANNQKIVEYEKTLNTLSPGMAKILGYSQEHLNDMKNTNESETLSVLNAYALANGIKQGTGVLEQMNYLMGNVKAEAAGAAQEAKKIANNLMNVGNIKFSLTKDNVKSALQSTFKDVQQQMADMASERLDAQAEASANQVQSYWDRRSDQLDKAQEAQTKRLEDQQEKEQDVFDRQQDKASRKFSRRQEDEQDAFDKRWQRRKDAIQKASDNRVKSIQKEMDAEQAADDARQKMFEAERKRIDRLADSANRSIDFKVAISTGNIDEAAKIQNDMQATGAQNAVDDAEDRTSSASKAKTDALQKTADAIQNQTDKELANLEKAETKAKESFQRRQERAQRHFQRLQELESRAFSKSQQLQADNLKATQDRAKDALDTQTKNAVAANAAEYAARKASLDKQLTLFTNFTVSSKAQLDKWMAKTGMSYSDFGITSGSWFNKAFSESLRANGASLASDQMWSALGADVAVQTVKGMGFGGLKGFANFIKTGNLPDNFGKKPKAAPTPKVTAANKPKNDGTGAQINHGGGMIGDGGTGRKGVARTTKGVGPGERLVLARDKEFMVNEKDAQKNMPLLQAINSGKKVSASPRNISPGGVGGNGPSVLSGLAAGVSGVGMAQGVAQAMKNAFDAKMGATASAMGLYSATGQGGVFGNEGNYSAEQLKNAAIIASVGASLGMSSRDIQIGIMTAIAESNLKNLDYGDRDSVGLFQQRTSQGWGTLEQIQDPNYAATQFFNHLKGITNRDAMLPWLAAQAVQRSAFSDGSNYQRWWDEAQGIFKSGLVRSETGYMMNGLEGAGGKHLPSVPGKGWSTPHDYLNGMGSPIYAFNDGFISKAKATTSGGSPGNGLYGNKYTSYGEVMEVTAHDGNKLLSAHMRPGTTSRWTVGQPVAGGTLLGYSDMTGNASGPHTHFEFNSSGNGNARGLMQGYGIGLDGGSKAGPVGGEMEDAGVDPSSGWTYGDLPGQAGYDPYTSMNLWIEAEKERADRAAKKAAKEAAKAEKAAEYARLEMDVVSKRSELVSTQNYLDLLRQNPKKNEGLINTWVFVKNQVKARYEAAVAAFEAYKKAQKDADKDPVKDVASKATVTTGGKKADLRIGALNTYVGTSAAATNSDLARLIPGSDFLALTEMGNKLPGVRDWLEQKNWGVVGGGNRDQSMSVMAYNKATQTLNKTGQRKLGDLKNKNIVGGNELRYANYGLFTDKASGRQTYQIAAHTVPAVGGTSKAIAPLFNEQWGNLDKLVTELKTSGLPVFLSGDLNVRKERDNYRAPAGLDTMANTGVDYVYGDSAFSKLVSQSLVQGLHTDHQGAVMSNFTIPSHADGAQNVTWDNTLVNLHKGEGVLTEAQNAKFRNLANNIDKVATGGNVDYSSKVEVTSNADAKQIAREIAQEQKKQERRRAMRRTVGS